MDISLDEVKGMWGNIICVKNDKDEFCLIMSQQAYDSYTDEHRKELEDHYKIIKADIKTIETTGGGSARCMVAEIFEKE